MSNKVRLKEENSKKYITGFGQFPFDWKKLNLDECAKIRDNERIPLNSSERGEKKPGNIPYYGANGVVDYINEFIFDSDLVLLAEDGGHFKQYQDRPIAYKISGKAWVNNHAHILEAKYDVITEYLFYSLEHRNLVPYITGSTRDKLTKTMLKRVKLPVPSLEEQKKIVSVLYNLDQIILQTEEIINQTKKIKKGLMQDLITEGYYNHEKFEETRTGPIKISKPSKWRLKNLSDVFEIIDGDRGKNYPSSSEFYEEGYCLFLNAGNVTSEGFNFDKTKFITKQKDEKMSRGKLERGDIIVTTRGTVGNIGFYSSEINHENMRINSGMIILRPKKECVRSYFYHFFNSEIFQKQMNNLSYGTAQLQISVSIAEKLKIIEPGLEEQKKIAEKIENLDQKISKNKQEKKHLERLKKGLMQDLLTGKVRTNDKPIEIIEEVIDE